VNPARSLGPAVFVGDWAVGQLWFFWVFPLIGGALAGLVYRTLFEAARVEPPITGHPRLST
jgi:aquaporin Z